MKLQYYSDTDSLYIDLSEKPGVESQEISEDLVVDYDQNGQIVGIDIQHASKTIALNSLEASSLPLSHLKAA